MIKDYVHILKARIFQDFFDFFFPITKTFEKKNTMYKTSCDHTWFWGGSYFKNCGIDNLY